MTAISLFISLVSVISSLALPYVAWSLGRRLPGLNVDQERRRLRAEVLGESEGEGADGAASSTTPHDLTHGTADTRFARLLIEYYAYGLTQASRSFSVSLSCSVLGGLVLLSGVAMAILKADTTGDQYASVTASVAGLLMTAIGTLFHRRADQALKHMESQTQSLRQDMKVERDASQAIRLLDGVDDSALKSHLQAALILKFAAAKLPELEGVLKPTDSEVAPPVNDVLLPQRSETPAS
ncbi:hypothetical protein [Streptomyces sp. NPDC050564]|uniref:TRADD-N-associated membrane domain-containing protein n=1 Tax=Streptomyces sp. NPDC050564 TaxID=3365631 RepID=UPI0037A6F08F